MHTKAKKNRQLTPKNERATKRTARRERGMTSIAIRLFTSPCLSPSSYPSTYVHPRSRKSINTTTGAMTIHPQLSM
jgi:hypothetical protein